MLFMSLVSSIKEKNTVILKNNLHAMKLTIFGFYMVSTVVWNYCFGFYETATIVSTI